MKTNRHLKMTLKYLKTNDLVAVPFDKGVGICLMKRQDYEQKLDKIINLPQFLKLEKPRSNAVPFIMKEEEDIIELLEDLLAKQEISQKAFDMMKPVGSKPPRLYGLAKVHKKDIPVRPVLSMPGSAYHKIGKFLSQFLGRVPECNIQTSSEVISKKVRSIELDDDEELISFDVTSLYTNVPVHESIKECAELLYRPRAAHGSPCFSKETFIKLATVASCNVVLLTHDGYYKQVDGLAMGAPLAPFLANAWMSKYDPIIASIIEEQPGQVREESVEISIQADNVDIDFSNGVNQVINDNNQRTSYARACKKDVCYSQSSQKSKQKKLNHCDDKQGKKAKLYERYMDDCITCMKRKVIELKLAQINSLHPSLGFTHEREIDGNLSALDMLLMHRGNEIHTTWFTKKTDTGLVLNFHSLSPMKYKRAIIIGMIHRIYRACSSWKYINESLEKAKQILKNNQYPLGFIEEILSKTLEKIILKNTNEKSKTEEEREKEESIMFFVQYRGKITDEFSNELKKICDSKESPAFAVPLKIIKTMRKMKTVLPSLKPKINKMVRSDVVYKITCNVCESTYVGQTVRHLTARFREHRTNEGPVKAHMVGCGTELRDDDIQILKEVVDSAKLLTEEALHIKEIKPEINKKEEFRSRKLNIKWLLDSIYG